MFSGFGGNDLRFTSEGYPTRPPRPPRKARPGFSRPRHPSEDYHHEEDYPLPHHHDDDDYHSIEEDFGHEEHHGGGGGGGGRGHHGVRNASKVEPINFELIKLLISLKNITIP